MNIWEGAVAVRRAAFDYARGLAGTVLVRPRGHRAGLAGVGRAATTCATTARSRFTTRRSSPTRHAEFYRFQARNRVWLARRNLPLPVGLLYVLNWAAVTGARLRSREGLVETLRGYRIGLRDSGGERRPMRWRTVWRMARAGRPPII